MTSVDIKQLIRNRGSIKKRLTTFEKYIVSIKDGLISPDSIDVQLRYDNNINLIHEFENIQKLIEEHCTEEELKIQFEEREPFENKYYSNLSFLKDYISKRTSPTAIENSSSIKDSLSNFLLPKIKLPVFNGEYDQWLEFKKNFMSTIDSNTYLNDIQKYNFLNAALEGYAKRVISGCDESQDYQRAWQKLCEKFDKTVFT
ncbi:uncharacterized protein LOC130451055 [Diorhabda sublineata]|uniref:uncharacterized protein LOC130451055 n=1 Tax=Diorhabda sublineata TaxID=1163346 RepID=UPI0024E14A89|nr:uncharacterized protein LOC130451055 [Diorhabda sublineata]